MEEPELAQLEESLRRLCHERDLSWVVDSIDEAIREGLSESINPGSSAYHQRGRGWQFGSTYDLDNSTQSNPQIRERPYSLQERVLLLLNALLGIYGDLPAIQAETLRVLNHGWEGRVPPTDSITWVAEGDSGDGSDFVLAGEPEQDRQRRQRVVEALLQIRSEVMG